MIEGVLRHYGVECRPTNIEPLGNAGGFSGAQFWKLQTPRGELCLRQWPRSHPSADRLNWIHAILRHAASHGCEFLPTPIQTVSDESLVEMDAVLFELTPWLPGCSDLASSGCEQKLRAAVQSLAKFHEVTRDFSSTSNSPGIAQRGTITAKLVQGELQQLANAARSSVANPFHAECDTIVQLASPHVESLQQKLRIMVEVETTVQPCVRDVWHDHFLFVKDDVTGLIDFGAMQVDTVATDLARLLGSLDRHHVDVWSKGISAYRECRELTDFDVQFIRTFHASNVILSGLNWVRWLLVDRRSFENLTGVRQRLEDIEWSLRLV